MPEASPAKTVVYAALVGNLAIAAIKFVAASVTGSAAMLSEGVHSLVDTINELLLLYGLRQAAQPPDANHPLGHGRELYFWSLIVALLVLALGGGVSLIEGIEQVLDPRPLERPFVNYVVLAASFVCEAASWLVGLREFRKTKGGQGYFEAFRESKDPSVFTVLFEDTAAIIGLLIAAAGVSAAHAFALPQLDGVASIGIAAVLTISAVLLARETKGLLIGEPALPSVRESLLRIAGADPGVATANGVLTIQMGPDQIFAALSAEFHDHLTASQIEECVNRIEAAVKASHVEITILFVKPQTNQTWQERISRLAQRDD
jgi:cation diffusion facilitator family transporter